jgi:GNAT superfamily N-acetyltransferase
MTELKIYDAVNKPPELERKAIVGFLEEHLGKYGDKPQFIRRALDYSLKEYGAMGGFTLTLEENGDIVGATIINRTGMGGYIPENILVYIATHRERRGKGYGKRLMEEAMNHAKGDIALHVEADNPARKLYEKLGFTNPYLEMRYTRSEVVE